MADDLAGSCFKRDAVFVPEHGLKPCVLHAKIRDPSNITYFGLILEQKKKVSLTQTIIDEVHNLISQAVRSHLVLRL